MENLKNLSLDELLELANEANQEHEEGEKKKTKKHVLDFMKDRQILPGLTQVPNYLIYYEYRRKWKLESRSKLRKTDFFREFSKHFEQKRTTNCRYYLLNEQSFDLSEENLKNSKDSDTLYENKIKKKKEQKESNKESKSQKGVHATKKT